MNILVMIKQVPDTTEIRVDKVTGALIRDGVPSIINPDDLAGVEAALQLKEKFGGKVTVITMGPQQAEGMLREQLGRGVDEAVLVCGREFAGADTCATSGTLAAAIKTMGADLIIAGRQAIDGDTAQVGPQTAERLGLPQVTYVEDIVEVKENSIVVKKSLEDCTQVVEAKLPCVITMLSTANTPRYMNCEDAWNAFDKEIKVLGFADLNIDASAVGFAGSPTSVKATFTKDVSAVTEKFDLPAKEAAALIAERLNEKGLIK